MSFSTNFSDADVLLGDRAVRHTASSGQKALRPNGGASFTDGEVLAVVVPSTLSSSTRCGLYIRGSGGSGSETAYMVEIPFQGNGLQLWRFNGGGFAQLDSVSDAVFDAVAGQRYYLRLSAVGTAIKAKVWEYGEDEPASWTLSATDAAISGPGWGGLRGRGDNVYDYYSEDSDSGSAPLPVDTPGANQFADDFSGQTVAADPPSGWTEEWNTGSSAWEVIDDLAGVYGDLPSDWVREWDTSGEWGIENFTGADGDKVLRQYDAGDNAWKLLRPTAVAGGTWGIKALGRINPSDGIGERYYLTFLLYPGGTSGDPTGYFVSFTMSSNTFNLRLRSYKGGVAPTLLHSVTGLPVGDWYWVRLEADGAEVRFKYWARGAAEPGSWTFTVANSDHSSGQVGLGSFSGGFGDENYVDVFESYAVTAAGIAPDTPTITQADSPQTTLTAETSAFSTSDPAPDHTSTRWQVRDATDPDWTTPVEDITTTDFLTSIAIDGMPASTNLEVRAAHGQSGVFSEWSAAVAFTSGIAVAAPDTPVITDPVDEVGEDFVTATRTAFDHAEGVGDGEPDEDGEVDPYELAAQWQVRESGASWDDAVVDTGLDDLYVGVLTATFEGLTAATSYEIRMRVQDGKYGQTSEWSNVVTFTTDAVPAVQPATPTLTVDDCGWPETDVSSSAFSHPEGGATHQASRWWIGTEDSDAVVRYLSIVTSDAAELTAFVWGQLSAGVNYLAVSHQDDSGRWSDRSAAVTCTIRERPDVPTLTSHAAGTSIDGDTTFTWSMPGTDTWDFTGELSSDNGATWEALFSAQESASYTLSVAGKPNGLYLLRIKACYPAAPTDCSDWLVIPFRIDRSGAASVDYRFSDYASLPADWVPMWDPSGYVSWTLVDGELDSIDSPGAGSCIGLLASHSRNLEQRQSVLAFTELGQPDTLDITVSFGILMNPYVWHGWRFSQSRMTGAGPAYRALRAVDTGAEKAGYAARVDVGGRGWPYGSGVCNSDSEALSERAQREKPIHARNFPDRLHQYGTSTGGAAVQLYGYREQRERHWLYDSGIVDTVGDLSKGLTYSVEQEDEEDEETLCRYRIVTYSARKRVTRTPDGNYRIRVQIYGPGIDPAQGPQVDRIIDPNATLASDPSWAFRDALCGYCGLYYWQLPFLTDDPGVLFLSASVSSADYEDCDPPDDPLFGCEADWDFTVFENDDITPWYGEADEEGNVEIADFYDRDTCPRPYLMPVREFSESEIDFPAGASTIGAIQVSVLDKRRIEDDDQTGIVTARLEAAKGRRAVLRRWREDLGMVTVFDGVVESTAVDSGSIVVVHFYLRDPRERERGSDLFSRNETFSLWPEEGPIEPYGSLPSGGYLIPAAPVQTATFDRASAETPDDGIHFGFVPLSVGGTVSPTGFSLDLPESLRAFWSSSYDLETGTYRYEDLTVRWRLASGGDWTYLRRAPRAFSAPMSSGAVTAPGAGQAVRPAWYFGAFESGDIPADDAAIEYQILSVRTSETTPFVWDRGSFGDLALEIFDGEHTISAPRFRFDRTAFETWADDTPPARLIVREPASNLREWMEQHIYAPIRYAPGFDADMREIPVPWDLPAADESLVTLDPDWIIPVGEFTDESESVVNQVSYTYIREFLAEQEEGEDLNEWERLQEREVIRSTVFAPSTFMGVNKLEYAPVTVRAVGNEGGDPITGDTADELGSQLAETTANGVLDRFGWGAHEYVAGIRSGMAYGPGFDPMTLDLVLGQWVIVKAHWLPQYPQDKGQPPADPENPPKRGMDRIMQIVSITDPEISERRIRLIDGGPNVDGLDPPTLDPIYEAATERKVTADVTAFPVGSPDDYEAVLQYAVSYSEPSATSGLWRPMGSTETVPESLLTPLMPSGATVWVRARGEAAGYRPSAWTTPQSIVLGGGPSIVTARVGLEVNVAVIEWTVAGTTEGVRIDWSVGAIGHTPSYGTAVDLPAADSPYTPVTADVSEGQEIYARITPYAEFTAGAVAGDSGTAVIAYASRFDGEAPAVSSLSVTRTEDGDCAVPTDMVHRIAWATSGTMTGHTVEIDRSIDGAAYTSVATGLSDSGTQDDTLSGVEHDVTDGTRTEYRYRARVVRTADGAVISQAYRDIVSYPLDCPAS